MRSLTEHGSAGRLDPQRAIRLWLAAGWVGLLALPWYAAPEATWLQLAAGLFSEPQAGNGLAQALFLGRPWLLVAPAALLFATLALRMPAGARQGTLLAACGGAAVLGLVFTGLAIRDKG